MTDYSAGAELPASGEAPAGEAGLASRLFNRRVGGMLLKNTAVSSAVFLVGLAVLWGLVQWGRMQAVPRRRSAF